MGDFGRSGLLFRTTIRLYAIKLFSILGDFAAAGMVFLIVKTKYRRPFFPLLAFFAVLFAPTVFFNSALWGQCDVLYTTGLLATLYFLLVHRPAWAMAAFGAALALKLQAVFLFPLLLVLALKKKITLKDMLWAGAVYAALLLPAWLLGRPWLELAMVYFRQAGLTLALNLSAPSLYHWLPNEQSMFVRAGLAFAAMIVATFCFVVYHTRVALHRDLLVKLALASVLVMPYTLPKMHERYFYAADLFSIVYAFYFPRYFYVPLLVIMSSLFSYFPFLFHREVFSILYLALIMGIAGLIVVIDLLRNLYPGLEALKHWGRIAKSS
jgi:Gpi18-like mannosyltransferase